MFKQILVGSFAVLLALPLLARADLGMTFVTPGTACRYYGYAGEDTFFRPNGLSANGLRNNSSSARYLTCPIVSVGYDSDHGNPDTAGVFATISSSTAVCSLYRRSISGTSWSSWGTSTISSASNGMWLHQIIPSTYYPTANYSIALYCEVPSQVYISSYASASWNHD